MLDDMDGSIRGRHEQDGEIPGTSAHDLILLTNGFIEIKEKTSQESYTEQN